MPWVTKADVASERAQTGNNVVRLLISWRCVEPRKGFIDQRYLDRLARRVRWYSSQGMYVILDMHQDVYGHAANGNGAPVWATHTDGLKIDATDPWELAYYNEGVNRAFDYFWGTRAGHPELARHYAKMWRAVAKRFAGSHAVIGYELMNEPWPGTLDKATFETGALARLYQQVTTAIRKEDQDTWILCEPVMPMLADSGATNLRLPKDPRNGPPRIAYAPHLYPMLIDVNGYNYRDNKAELETALSIWKTNTAAFAKKNDCPVLLGEFGLDLTAPGALDYVDRVVQISHFQMIAGVTYWSNDAGTWGPFPHSRPEGGADLDRPGPMISRKRWARLRPHALAGRPTKIAYADPRSVTVTMEVPRGGHEAPSVVWVPPGVRTPKVEGERGAQWRSTFDQRSRLLRVWAERPTRSSVQFTVSY